MPEPKKRGPKPTGRRKVVRYWTPEETGAADHLVQHMRLVKLEATPSHGNPFLKLQACCDLDNADFLSKNEQPDN